MKTLLIDNYNSYTFNIYQWIAQVNGDLPIIIRNDQVTWSAVLPGKYQIVGANSSISYP